MRKNSLGLVLVVGILMIGCNRSPTLVFVDRGAILRNQPASKISAVELPKPPQPRPEINESILGAAAVKLDDPANRPKQSVQEMFDADQAAASAELQRRLRQFYLGQVDEFRLMETQSVAHDQEGAYAAANVQIRTVFEAWAAKRAPIFAKLALIQGFPLSSPAPAPSGGRISGEQQRREEEVNRLRASLNEVDAKFKSDSNAILESVRKKSEADQTALQQKIREFAINLDRKAEVEAKSQIREAVSKLRFQLADPTPISFPPSPAKHLWIPAESAVDAAPKPPSSGILEGKDDRRRLLDHELRIWLALNVYKLSEDRKGCKDATLEFQKWRELHGVGP